MNEDIEKALDGADANLSAEAPEEPVKVPEEP